MSKSGDNGKRMYEFASKIFPYTRSITGEGVRQTLDDIEEYIRPSGVKLNRFNVPTGKPVFDWTVPKEWIIREAYIEDESGNHIIDMKENNLHVLGYSTAIDEWVDLDELKKHVYVEDGQPEVIPYVTSYYKERYGFCMSKNMLDSLADGKYHMYIDSELIDGNLTYAEVVIPGRLDDEILFSTYFCHPSMANNECSGLALQSELINYVATLSNRKYTYRFVFVPETIGSITYLSQCDRVEYFKKHLKAGYILSCVGDNNAYSMIPSKYGNTVADKTLDRVLKNKENYTKYTFRDRGSDERQYNSAGVDLPVVCYCRSKFGLFPEYHTSADNMTYVSEEGFQGSFDAMSELISGFEDNAYYLVSTKCEPQLGKRGLYSNLSRKGTYDGILVQRDVISYADGTNTLRDMAEIIGISEEDVMEVMTPLIEAGLIEER